MRLLPGWKTLLHTFSVRPEVGVLGEDGVLGLVGADPEDGIDNDLRNLAVSLSPSTHNFTSAIDIIGVIEPYQ